MDEEILVDALEAVRAHPWTKARTRLTLALLDRLGVCPPARILDAGCGWGVTLEALERCGYRIVGMDISRRALERIDRHDRTLIEADLTQDLPSEVEPFDAVLALDVIEHLDDDRAALRQLAALVDPRGVAVVSVPALPELFSADWDVAVGHRRRYLPEGLRAVFDGSGLVIERLLWWGAWLVPLFRRQRRRAEPRPGETPTETYCRHLALPPWPLPLLLQAAFALELGPTLRGRLKTGTSLFVVARRPG